MKSKRLDGHVSREYHVPMRVIAWDHGDRYIVVPDGRATPETVGRIVDTSGPGVSDPLKVGSMLSHAEADEWDFRETGPDAARAVQLANGSSPRG